MPKKQTPRTILEHAAWHCRFGSESTERTPEPGDVAAAELLEQLRDSFTEVANA